MYADLNMLMGRAGRLSPAWSEDSDPDLADLEGFLAECSAILDLAIGGHQIDTPVTDANAVLVLGGIAADGALAMAIEATWPGEAPADVAGLLEATKGRWDKALAGIREGADPVISFLLASPDDAPLEPGATSFWVEEPFYPVVGVEDDHWDPQRPAAYRGQGY